MHNGGIAEFNKIKRTLQQALPDAVFEVVAGNTDSEWAFALFLSKLPDANAKTFTTAVLKQAMLDTISHLNELADSAGITEVSRPAPVKHFHSTDLLAAESAQFLCHRRRDCDCHSIYLLAARRSCLSGESSI
jgi:predicted glutamine amidotransferase